MTITANEIGSIAARAMYLEVTSAPKPGLVSRFSSGAHQDMNYQTFLHSIRAIAPHLPVFAQIGADGADREPAAMLASLRLQGTRAEQDMFRATRGVNTHKGSIFALGLLCAAAGRLNGADPGPDGLTPENLCAGVAETTKGICDRDFAGMLDKPRLSSGEAIYLRYGIKGARGEAESGFAQVRRHAYPVLDSCLQQKQLPLDQVLLQVLLHLMANLDDTNIIARHDLETAREVREQAGQILALGGALTGPGSRAIAELDQSFCGRRISPGGCADLLAVTLMIWMLSHHDQR